MYTTLIDIEELQEKYCKDSWVIIDCRFYLKNEQLGYENYLQSHIPGAVYANLNIDLSGITTLKSGRHPLPNMQDFCTTLGLWGIDQTKQVVVYDDNGGAISSRLWWMLRYLQHQQVAVLNGGWTHWQQKKYSVESGLQKNKKTEFVGKPKKQKKLSLQEVVNNRHHYVLVDSRSTKRYNGEQEPIDPIAGHIPGAINYCHENNVDAEKIFLSQQQLHKNFGCLLNNTSPEKVVFYCGSGVTACRNILAMEHIGKKGAKLFVGSWSEWCRNSELPIATNKS
ncbi:sulfurtransferase [Candidatus Uabimicrobium sp. HlEnr_7]|uniref:sulfurtransferase n=1 Tax=Candidatus Uabimicrobium helgolandensis TaxID=3095367 RepID=UPI003556A099